MAEMTSRIIDRDGGAGKGLEVGDDRDRFGAGALGLVPDLLDQRRAIDQREPAAFVREAQRHGPPNALGRAGDDGDLAGEALRKDHLLLRSPGSDVVDVHDVVDVVIL
jgi:hypothetical protein